MISQLFKFFKDSDERHYSKARKRLEARPSRDVLLWADSGVWAVQEGLDGYRSQADRAALEQARTGIVGVLAAVDTLLDRPH